MKKLIDLFNKTISWRHCLISILLLSPVILFYIAHYLHGIIHPEFISTGFIQMDMPYYMANAREYFDNPKFSIFYSSPFSSNIESQPIYFQFHIFLLALVLKVTGLNAGIVFVSFGFLSGFLCILMAMRVFHELFGLDNPKQWLIFVMFCWGGGIAFITGFFYSVITGNDLYYALKMSFAFDPFSGYWMTNFGRNLVYPTEAYYHFVVFGIIYSVIKNKHILTCILLFILSFSQPYTGLEILLIVVIWQIIERFYLQNKNIELKFITINISLLFLVLSYYLIFLNSNIEHKSLFEQWSLDWTYKLQNFIPLYIPVFLLFAYQIRNPTLLKQFFSKVNNRFFFAFACIAFLLANHEFAFSPKQPLHFTHGYIWIPLFFLGANTLETIINKLLSYKKFASILIILMVLLFTSDNISWFGLESYKQTEKGAKPRLSRSINEVINFINNNYNRDYLLIAEEKTHIGYLAVVYTPVRAFVSHTFNTPFFKEKSKMVRRFYKTGLISKDIQKQKLLIIKDKTNDLEDIFSENNKFENVFENDSYIVYTHQN